MNWKRIAVLLWVLGTRAAAAQTADSIVHPSGTTVTGVVRDSIGQAPLAGAIVQLVGVEPSARVARATTTDSLGRFVLDGVPAGRYSLGFFHPVLESLGIEPPVRDLFLLGQGVAIGDLATPSPARFREAVCGTTDGEPGAVVVGVVRDPRDHSVTPSVTVTAEWLEVTISRKGMAARIPHLIATTAENGWFALCNVPGPGTMTLRAVRSRDSTDLLEVEVAQQEVLREDLYLPTRRSADTASRERPGLARAGDGVLRGTVVSASDGQPLPGSRVGIFAGPQVRTGATGEWTIGNAPLGTRMLEARAVGYYPQRRLVNVIAGAPPIRIALSTLRAVLDTIKISATLVRPDQSGFQERSRTGAGTYLTSEDVLRRASSATSDIFRTIPSVTLELDPSDGVTRHISMRGSFGRCEPTIFLDGVRMPQFTADDIDEWLSPKEVAGVEIYSEASAPGEFRDFTRTDDICGSIVIWKKKRK